MVRRVEILIDGEPADVETLKIIEGALEADHQRMSDAWTLYTETIGQPSYDDLMKFVAEMDKRRDIENSVFLARRERESVKI